MPYSNAQLLGVLGEIKGGGTFVSSGVQSFIFPGLQINGLDEISFPVNISQIRKMIKVAHKAPFGKGSETVLDTSVRSNLLEMGKGFIALMNIKRKTATTYSLKPIQSKKSYFQNQFAKFGKTSVSSKIKIIFLQE